MKRLWRDYSLTIVLVALFLASWVGQFVSQVFEIREEAATHGQSFAWSEFWPQFLSATFENWQSEFLQLTTMVVLTAYLVHRGSHESKDGDERVERALVRIEERLQRIEAAAGTPPGDHAPALPAAANGRTSAGTGSRR